MDNNNIFAPKITHRIAGIYVNPALNIVDSKLAANWPDSELPYGWAGEWTNANTIGFEKHFALYKEVTQWIETNINNCQQNAKWAKIGDCIYVQLRKKKDFMWFTLRFGA